MTAAEAASTCDIHYVYLEMVLAKDKNYDVLAGLFKGIVEKKGQKFILLQGLKNATNVLSLKYYNLMTIEVREGDYKNYTYLTCEQVDQDKGLEMVETLNRTLLAAKFGVVNDPTIIDTDKYTEVPDDYKGGKALNTGTANTGTASGVGNFATPGSRYTAGTTYTKQTTVKPDPTPGTIKRTKKKKPTKAVLDEMFEKVQQIQAGTFELELPEIMGADDAGETEADDDFGNGYYGAYCG
jgi:hypothetical protein